MRKFINTTTDDLWTAIRDNKIIESSTSMSGLSWGAVNTS